MKQILLDTCPNPSRIHDNLRKQHPEWVLPNGESPICDVYEARLMDLLALVPGFYLRRATERQHIGY